MIFDLTSLMSSANFLLFPRFRRNPLSAMPCIIYFYINEQLPLTSVLNLRFSGFSRGNVYDSDNGDDGFNRGMEVTELFNGDDVGYCGSTMSTNFQSAFFRSADTIDGEKVFNDKCKAISTTSADTECTITNGVYECTKKSAGTAAAVSWIVVG